MKYSIPQKLTFLICFVCLFIGEQTSFAQTEYTTEGEKITIERYLEESEKKREQGDAKEASRFLNKVATIYWEKKDYDKAIHYYEKSLDLNASINNEQGMLGIYSNLGMIYSDKEDFNTSLDYFQKTLKGRKKGKDKVSIISTHINVSIVLNNLKRHAEAASHLEDALTLATEMSDAAQMKSCYGMLAETYDKAGDNTKSLKYFNLYRTFHEMVQRDREQKIRESEAEAKLKAQLLEVENKNKELAIYNQELELQQSQRRVENLSEDLADVDSKNRQLLNTANRKELIIAYLNKQKELDKAELKQKEQEADRAALIRNVMIFNILVLIAFGVFIYRRYQGKKKTNLRLEQQNIEITAQQEQIIAQRNRLETAYDKLHEQSTKITKSINYASRIQSAILPAEETLSSSFDEHFIFFRPRDIVSGDFYWLGQQGKRTVIAAADCTGHGVPGAFMSMIGNDLLNKYVNQFGITEPDQILTELDKDIRATLQQEKTAVQDGMDLALCVYDHEKKQLEYAGAMNPLYYFQNGSFHEIKATKKAVGGRLIAQRSFRKHCIPIEEVSTFYIFSDGFADQFGGPKGRKFMSKRFKNFLTEIHLKPMNEQDILVRKAFDDWKGEHEQLDDVLVTGFQIKP